MLGTMAGSSHGSSSVRIRGGGQVGTENGLKVSEFFIAEHFFMLVMFRDEVSLSCLLVDFMSNELSNLVAVAYDLHSVHIRIRSVTNVPYLFSVNIS